jgi:hypothetical protein
VTGRINVIDVESQAMLKKTAHRAKLQKNIKSKQEVPAHHLALVHQVGLDQGAKIKIIIRKVIQVIPNRTVVLPKVTAVDQDPAVPKRIK